MIRKIKILITVLFPALALFAFSAQPCFAEGTQIANKNAVTKKTNTTMLDEILKSTRDNSIKISTELVKHAKNLLIALACISFSFFAIKHVFDGANFNTLFAEMVKFIMGIGFFMYMLNLGPTAIIKIVEDFVSIISINVSSKHNLFTNENTTAINLVSTIYSQGWDMLTAIARRGKPEGSSFDIIFADTSMADMFQYYVSLVLGGVIMIVFTFISVNYLLTLSKAYITACCAILAVGFGGLTWTNSWAINYCKQLIKIGFELMTFVFVVKLLLIAMDYPISAIKTIPNVPISFLVMGIAMSLLTLILSNSLPKSVSAMIEGGATGSFDMSAVSQIKLSHEIGKAVNEALTKERSLPFSGNKTKDRINQIQGRQGDMNLSRPQQNQTQQSKISGQQPNNQPQPNNQQQRNHA
ncbi:type IV secretion system protein [Ruminobacter sp. RM87]|uniref:type IV secretion system protein n=1 Tax=Ruminobacter sp. RM87 TaxID=1200567 RepID=UPI0004E1F112|nr:type IV secretion system protein [Ruminobacter sp. RM87]